MARNVPGAAFHEARADTGGFKKFLVRGNVVDRAVGVVIGAAFGSVVQAFAKDIIQPLTAMFGAGPSAGNLTWTVGNAPFNRVS